MTDYGPVSSLAKLQEKPSERKYFFDQPAGWADQKSAFC